MKLIDKPNFKIITLRLIIITPDSLPTSPPKSKFIDVKKKSLTTPSGRISENTFPKTPPKIAPTNNEIIINSISIYKANENKKLVKNKKEIDENILKDEFIVVDARSRERFEGKVAEPRKGLRSGSIKNSFCVPFSELLNEDHTFVAIDEIREKFNSTNFDINKNVVFSCGSGVTASVLALAYSLINAKYMPTIYDGSWAEYGKN